MKKYYAVEITETRAKTILVPCDLAENVYEAADLVAANPLYQAMVEEMEPEYDVAPSSYADIHGKFELAEDEVELYTIVSEYNKSTLR